MWLGGGGILQWLGVGFAGVVLGFCGGSVRVLPGYGWGFVEQG